MELEWQEWIDKIRLELDLVELSDETIGMLILGALAFLVVFSVARRVLRPKKRIQTFDLSRPLLGWSQNEALTIGRSCEGIFCCGATGSGKTSGSGKTIAEAMLGAGYGALVCTVKPDEVALWREYCRRTGRLRDLVIFGRGQGYNFLRHETERAGSGAGLVENISDLLSIGCEIADRAGTQGAGGQEDAAFWKNARQQACRNAVVPLNIAYGGVSVPDLYSFFATAPTSVEEAKAKKWQSRSFCFDTFRKAESRCRPEQEEDLGLSWSYFARELPSVGSKTRSNISMTLTSMTDVLNRELARELLSGKTTITPEMLERGKIVVLDVPIGEYGLTGRLIQGIVKYCFQRAMLRRNVQRSPRPVVFWIDECQFLVNSYDMHFLSTCRSFKVANFYASQNLSAIYSALGGLHKGKAEADSILANLNLKIMHANGCPLTNEWAAQSIGQSRQYFFSGNNNFQGGDWVSSLVGLGGGSGASAGYQEQMTYEVQPSEFTRLRTGGPQNGWNVDAILFQSGRVFADTGKTWRRVTFRQKP